MLAGNNLWVMAKNGLCEVTVTLTFDFWPTKSPDFNHLFQMDDVEGFCWGGPEILCSQKNGTQPTTNITPKAKHKHYHITLWCSGCFATNNISINKSWHTPNTRWLDLGAVLWHNFSNSWAKRGNKNSCIHTHTAMSAEDTMVMFVLRLLVTLFQISTLDNPTHSLSPSPHSAHTHAHRHTPLPETVETTLSVLYII